jgi:hypothetical protein
MRTDSWATAVVFVVVVRDARAYCLTTCRGDPSTTKMIVTSISSLVAFVVVFFLV